MTDDHRVFCTELLAAKNMNSLHFLLLLYKTIWEPPV